MKSPSALIFRQKTRIYMTWCLAFVGAVILNSCNQQAIGFALPPGNIDNGKMVFENMACNQCHSVGDIPWTGIAPDDYDIKLGGEVIHVKTYGELVTSIINPSHRVSRKLKEATISNRSVQSPMPSYNQIMTVQELIDLVTYLQSEYDLKTPEGFYSPL